MQVLLPVFYLPPISWFAVFLKSEEATLEAFENFPKQTYRNRTTIYGANGRLSMIIPINHTGKRVMREIEVSNRENWRKLHWKSIKTAYQSSPYFEFYEDQLETIFTFDSDLLIEFSLNAIAVIQKILKTNKTFNLTNEYLASPMEVDFRQKFSTKKESEYTTPEYYQAFSDKFGFEGDLSVIDLICNKGPESLTYLTTIEIN